jgi:general secretion pathway protein K
MAMVNTAKAPAKQQAKQQGVALITALLIFSLVAIAAVAMADRQSLDIRRTENLIHYDQAYMYALGAELFAAEVLANGDQDKNIDTLNPDIDPWNTELPPVPVDGGTIGGFIRDATARFPINNMVDANGARQPVYVNAFQRFVDYMTSGDTCGEQSSFNPDLSQVVVDWIDKNEQVEVGGAEDMEYLSGERPYRTANQPMASISELRSLKNLIAEEYNCFVGGGKNPPLINTINDHEVPININTAPPAVIQSIHNGIDDNLLQMLIENREEEPYKETSKFIEKIKKELFVENDPEQRDEIEQFDKQMEQMNLSVGSQYYEVTSIAQIGRLQVTVISLLKRDGNKITTLQRTIGTF